MTTPQTILEAQARRIGLQLGLDWTVVRLAEFRRGLEVELEHGARDAQTDVTHDDLLLTGKIAWAHLKEFPDYYTRLAAMEKEADLFWAARRAAGAKAGSASADQPGGPPAGPEKS